MPTWDAKQYLSFREQRTRPCRELAERIALNQPRLVMDLGCGPGNSTETLAARWPGSLVGGLDSSEEMIAAARQACPTRDYRVGDISAWAAVQGETYDIVFSNAALQWVGDHALLFPRLMKRVAGEGALAVQMPGNFDAPAHEIMREMADSPEWRNDFTGGVREWHIHDLPFYYDVLAPCAATLDLWTTEYIHVMDSAEAITQWYKGTGLRPFLDLLATDKQKQRFESEYTERLRVAYPPQPDGSVLFPFRRLFIIAYAINS